MMQFKPYSKSQMAKDIREAIKKYKKLHGRMADKIKTTKLTLPKIIKENEEIDLDKMYKDYKIVATQVGVALGVLYVQEKGNNDTPMVFFHAFEKPRVILTTDDGKSLFIAEDGCVMVDERGIVA